MKSVNELKITDRTTALQQWLREVLKEQFVSMQALPGDASFRRYFRMTTSTGSFIAMDAPPPQESCKPFVAIAEALRNIKLQAPEIIAANEEQGFLLLTDFGDQTYLKALNSQNADQCYERALSALAVLQTCREVKGLIIPPFTFAFMQQEWLWHKEWFLNKLLDLKVGAEEAALDKCFTIIAESAVNQPQVFMHRDYHSGNLMLLPTGDVGILDFQDAFIGPVTYDLVSLLRDCYIDWPNEQVEGWVFAYLQKLHRQNELINVDKPTFQRWFDLMGLERHLKALFTFARKHVRDQQPQYLKHIPRTLNYIIKVSQHYPELTSLHSFMRDKVQPAATRILSCAQ